MEMPAPYAQSTLFAFRGPSPEIVIHRASNQGNIDSQSIDIYQLRSAKPTLKRKQDHLHECLSNHWGSSQANMLPGQAQGHQLIHLDFRGFVDATPAVNCCQALMSQKVLVLTPQLFCSA